MIASFADLATEDLYNGLDAQLGQYSIRINQQYRVCFSWMNNNAYDVEVTDYH